MTTILYFDDDRNPVAMTNFADEIDAPADQPNTIRIDGTLTVAFDVIQRQYRIVAGALIDVGAPPQWYRWNAVDEQWVEDLEGAKAAVWTSLKTLRDRAEFGGFVFDGFAFDSDVVSQSRIQGAALLAVISLQNGQPFETEWTLADNTAITLDGPQMIAVGQALAEHVFATHAKGRLLRAAIEGATSVGDLDAVEW